MIAYDSNEDSLHTGVVRFIWYAADSAPALVRSYDPYGRAAGISLGPDYAVGYGYDEYGRFSTVAVSNGATFTYSYVPDSSLLAGYTNDLGLAVAYAYEPHRDLKTLVSNAWGTNVISTFFYTYDPLGRRTHRIDDSSTTNLFGYNLRSELVSALMGTNSYSYAYDPIGNRTSSSENGTQTTYAANELNQYTTLNPASTNPTPFTYDPDGNMTSDGIWSYSWDAENRLIEVQPLVTNLDSTLVQYMYDSQSRRIARREFAWSDYLGETTWHYVQGRAFRYDGWNLLQELKPATTPRTPPTYIPQTNLYLTGVNGRVAAKYVWGLDLAHSLHGLGGVGGLLCTAQQGTNTFLSYDANGNVTTTTDALGTIRQRFYYAPFGQLLGTNVVSRTMQFQTKLFDPPNGTLDFGRRMYSLEYGRWLSRDFLGEAGGPNEVVFVENNPINSIDVLGYISFTVHEEDHFDPKDDYLFHPFRNGKLPAAETTIDTKNIRWDSAPCENGNIRIVNVEPKMWVFTIRYRRPRDTQIPGRFKTIRGHEGHHVMIDLLYLRQWERGVAIIGQCTCARCKSKRDGVLHAFWAYVDFARKTANEQFDCKDYSGPIAPNTPRGEACANETKLRQERENAYDNYNRLYKKWLTCLGNEER